MSFLIITPIRYTEDEKKLLLKLRKRFPNIGQRTLARQIEFANLPGVWKNKVMVSDLYERSTQSIYGAIRRLDKKLAQDKNLEEIINNTVAVY